MKVEYYIKKKRGRERPTLHIKVKITKEDAELNLAIGNIHSTIPKPRERTSRISNLSIKDERDEKYSFDVYLYKSGDYFTWNEVVLLPWRPGKRPEYPEVHESIKVIRKKVQHALDVAYNSGPINEYGKLDFGTPRNKEEEELLAYLKGGDNY